MRAPTIVMTSGVFDLCHRGHLNLLWRAKQLGDLLVVGVLFDSGAHAYKHDWPLQSTRVRLDAVRHLNFVDFADLQPTTDPTPLLERWRPEIFVHGDDWDRLIEGNETLERLGVEYVTLPYTPGISTTQLKQGLHEKE